MDKTQAKEKSKEPLDLLRLIKLLAPRLIYTLGGFLCGIAVLPFSAVPFGIALLSAADSRAIFVYPGLAIACLFLLEGASGAIFLGVYTAIVLLRALVRLTLDYPPLPKEESKPRPKELLGILFEERVGYRMICATLSSLALGVCLVVGGGFLYYDLIGLVILLSLAPIATYVFSGAFSKGGYWRELGALGILAACTWGAAPLNVYGVSIAVLGGLFVTFLVTQGKGLGYGCVTGLVIGMVYSPILSPIFVISALCIGLFMKISPTLACFCAFVGSAAWGFYVKGIYALNGIFAAILSACLLYSVAHKLFFAKVGDGLSDTRRTCELGEDELDGIRLFDINRRMSVISHALALLCGFFEEIKLRYPKQTELMNICRDALDSSCSSCPMSEGCEQRERIENAAGRLSFLLRKNRGLSALDFDKELVSRCSRLPDILDEINYNSGLRINSDTNYGDADEVSAPDYRALSRLLEKSMECQDEEYFIDRETSKRICRALDGLEADGLGAMVYGRRRRNIYVRARDIGELRSNRERILEQIESALPFRIDKDTADIRRCSGEGGAMSVCEAERFEVEYTFRQIRAKGERCFCGDSVSSFKNLDSRFYSLISDGMGSGREAAAVSEICSRFMESMLKVGRMNDELLMLLGGVISGRCEGSLCECSATIDLMELDLISGKATFFKSGAAPTYVWREGNLFKLRSRSLPIGILYESEAKRIELELSEGDVVVMISDGVNGGEEECPWLFDLLRQNVESSEIERMADLIIKYAVGHGSSDDISVAVMRIR